MTRHLLVSVILAASASAAAEPPPLRVDDFADQDLEAAPGLSWTAIGDWLVGGKSSGKVSVAGGALRLEGHLRPGGPTPPFASAWTSLSGDGAGVDLAGYRALRFRARGTPGRYLAGVRRTEDKKSGNVVAPFEVGAKWARVELALADLASDSHGVGWAPTGVGWVGFTSGPDTAREFELEIDDVELVPARDAAPPPWSMRKVTLDEPRALSRLAFRSLARDPRGDGARPALPDAAELQVAVDPADDRVWFRVVLHDPPPDDWFGLNVALDVDGDAAGGMAWWGQNKAFHFDRLLTAYLSRGSGYWQGMAGVADAAQIGAGHFDGTSSDVRVVADRTGRALAIGVPRASLGLGREGKARVIATVGSSMAYSDDLPAEGAIDVVVPGGDRSMTH